MAGYYFDITDPANASEGDAQSLPASFIASVISSCEHNVLGTPGYIVGLRPCFEGVLVPKSPYRLVPSVAYPPGWAYAPMAQAFNWNVSAIR